MTETTDPGGDPLALDGETMRALGHRTVDALVDLLLESGVPALRRASPEEMARRLPAGAAGAEVPRSFDALLDQLREDVFPFMSRLDHPGYFAFIPACGTFPGALGDLLASALNPYVGTWMEAAGPSRLELVVLSWFKEWIGYPEQAAGVLVSGGSSANMTALACARETLLGPMTSGAVAYVSDQGHSSFARAARLLGFRPDQLRVLPTDRRDRPARRAGPCLPRPRRLVPRRRRLRRVRRHHRTRACGAGGHRAGRLGDARSAQVALPAVRVRLAAGPRRAPPAPRVRDRAGLPEGLGRRGR